MTTRIRGTWMAAAVSLSLLAACAQNPGQAAGTPSGESASSAPPEGALVLRVERVGGFAGPNAQPGRVPQVSVYADGRVISEGPTTAIFPGAALPNLRVTQIDPAEVTRLAQQATDAGVGAKPDVGMPGVADAPSVRFVLLSAGGRTVLDVPALTEAPPNDPRLTDPQRSAREKLAALYKKISELPATGTDAGAYRASAVAALARPYTAGANRLPSRPAAVTWPGPALPGEKLPGGTGCVTATGDAAAKVLAAAEDANTETPWTSGGADYRVVLRPLLPDETGCADLTGK